MTEFNITKCNVLRITRQRVPVVFNYTLHGCYLDEIGPTKYLGGYFSKDLRWNEHVKYIRNKAKIAGFSQAKFKALYHINKGEGI